MPNTDTANLGSRIERFLAARVFAVAGASQDPRKYGHKVFRCYLQHGRKAYPVNLHAAAILGQPAFPSLAALPERVEAISIITPPPVTEQIIDEAIAAGVTHVWIQPGAESPAAVEKAEQAGLNVIAGGPCILVVMGYCER